jgi:hypothetical protein
MAARIRRTSPDSGHEGLRALFSRGEPADLKAVVYRELEPIFDQCEIVVGVDPPDPTFRRGLVEAVSVALLLNDGALRVGDLRKQLRLVQQRSRTTNDAQERLYQALEDLPGALREALFDYMKKANETDWILASIAPAPELLDQWHEFGRMVGSIAESMKDRGGPRRFSGFDLLIQALADAFGRATGRAAAVTRHQHRSGYEGRFWDLIELIRPKIAAIADQRGRALPEPSTDGARGKFIERVLKRIDITPRTRS